ncbi:hypothetical protein GZL_05845 [Streptomyces sp. 769]|nr:hypothetical protein GZL_05845 [Streptomyces sp. 769]
MRCGPGSARGAPRRTLVPVRRPAVRRALGGPCGVPWRAGQLPRRVSRIDPSDHALP